jgi:hypothetical protein
MNITIYGLSCVVVLLIGLSFGLQLYAGSRIYFREPDRLARSLNMARTFRLGWQNLDLYPIMITWSLVMAVLVIVVVMAAIIL